jgi:nuclear pore complex protein Nup98-Nup96
MFLHGTIYYSLDYYYESIVLLYLTISLIIFYSVHFRYKEVMLYPDDEKKPKVGCGLNRRAQVTLDRVWPVDKTTHNPITNPERLKQMDYEGKLRRVCAKLKTRFLEYRPQTGSWVFKVST